MAFSLHLVKRKFWFDVNPPLAKFFLMLVALVTGVDADKVIGHSAEFIKNPDINFAHFRLVSCLFWVLSAVVIWMILNKLKMPHFYTLLSVFLLSIGRFFSHVPPIKGVIPPPTHPPACGYFPLVNSLFPLSQIIQT